jgi:hypothetical protein
MFYFQPYRHDLTGLIFKIKMIFFFIFIIELFNYLQLSTMEIALERIRNCVNGKLDLSGLGLTLLPPIPEGIIELNCSSNQLTFLQDLPSTLERLYCSNNKLSRLPALPPSLEDIRCSKNLLTTLPKLPPSLAILRCYNNKLTSLPTLPLSMISIICYSNRLTRLPLMPSNLLRLNCLENPLETLPELPSTLQDLKSELPWNEDFVDDKIYGGPMTYSGMYPELVEGVNQMVREAEEFAELTTRQSMERCMKRCETYFDELMQNRWHPERVFHLRKMGYMPDDMY